MGDINRTPWFGERNDRKTELGGWGGEEGRESLEGDYDKSILISQTIKYYFFKKEIKSWRANSESESMSCFCRGPEFGS